MGLVPKELISLLTFSYEKPQQRILAGALVFSTVFAVTTQNAECPSWSLGIPCPGCGMSRAIHSLLKGNLVDAFSYNVLFPYWLLVVGATIISILLYSGGWLRNPDSLGKRVLDAIPIKIHAALWLVSLLYNFYHYGLNMSGWVPRLVF